MTERGEDDSDQLDAALAPELLPHLARFLAADLREDRFPAHGGAARAAYEFAAEAEPDEVEQLAREWWALRLATRALPLQRIRRILGTRFGSAWDPISAAEIEAVGDELDNAIG
jgi:hypothetical protein